MSDRLKSLAVLFLDGGEYAVFKGAPPPDLSPSDACAIGPVYWLQPAGSLAVPTGSILVRFEEGTSIQTRQEALQDAGYEIERSFPYAPYAGWIRATSNSVEDALNGIVNLEQISDIVNVEPQMLMEAVRR